MITVKNVKTQDGKIMDLNVEGAQEFYHDAKGKWLALPALIDPLVNINSTSENWVSKAQSALSGGITTLFGYVSPSCETKKELEKAKDLINLQLQEAHIPLHTPLYMEATSTNADEVIQSKKLIIGIKLSLDLLLARDVSVLNQIFQTAAFSNLVISVFEEENKMKSKVKIQVLNEAIHLAQKYNAELIWPIHYGEELDQIRKARQAELLVYAKISPLTLIPLKEEQPTSHLENLEALWTGIDDDSIDLIGSGLGNLGKFPLFQLTLPLLLTAYNEGRLSLIQIITLARMNAENIFRLKPTDDLVLVDLEKTQYVQGKLLLGWPLYTLMNGRIFPTN
jgi:dihydroorotase-like cyclic amidohydrolase